jgi:diketogulonate reductase-like aldo/keto reductase
MKSIEESLGRLRAEYVDYLLLHEVRPAEVTDELLEALAQLRGEERLHRIGLATSVASAAQVMSDRPESFDAVQVSHYRGAFQPAFAGERLVVTHGCVGSGIPLIGSPEFRRIAGGASNAEMNRMLEDPRQAPDLLLAAGLQANKGGLVLVASSRPERLRRLAEVATSAEMTAVAAQLNACFFELFATMTATGHD